MTFTKNEVWECYQFARQMRGKHNRSMIMDRDDCEFPYKSRVMAT